MFASTPGQAITYQIGKSDLLRLLARTAWFDEGICRGARHSPAGFVE